MGLVQIRPDKFGGAHVQLNARGRPGEQFPIEAQGANLAEALRSMMDQFIDRVSVSRSFVSGSQTGGRLTLRLRGIGSYENYRQSVASIRALEMVDNLHVVQLSLDEVVLELDIGSGIPLLIDAIELDESLRAENYQPGADQVILRFVTGQDS